jgi:hypothetical protein
MIAEFDFDADSTDENQLSMTEGDKLIVVERADHAGNPDWWLVSNAKGQSGYVPGNYLKEP